MTDKAIFDEKGAWGKFKTLAPMVYKLVNSKAGKGNAGSSGVRLRSHRYGRNQATALKDQVVSAFVFGFVSIITLGCMLRRSGRGSTAGRNQVGWWVSSPSLPERDNGGGNTVSHRACRWRLAFIMKAFTSLGGMAARSDHVQAERQGRARYQDQHAKAD